MLAAVKEIRDEEKKEQAEVEPIADSHQSAPFCTAPIVVEPFRSTARVGPMAESARKKKTRSKRGKCSYNSFITFIFFTLNWSLIHVKKIKCHFDILNGQQTSKTIETCSKNNKYAHNIRCSEIMKQQNSFSEIKFDDKNKSHWKMLDTVRNFVILHL